MSDNEVLYQSAGGRVRNIPNEPSFSERAGPNERNGQFPSRVGHWSHPMGVSDVLSPHMRCRCCPRLAASLVISFQRRAPNAARRFLRRLLRRHHSDRVSQVPWRAAVSKPCLKINFWKDGPLRCPERNEGARRQAFQAAEGLTPKHHCASS